MGTEIWADGSCPIPRGPGGYCAILVHGDRRKIVTGGVATTTNQRMEIVAITAGLRALTRPARVTVVSDSKYALGGFSQGWIERWERNGWRNAKGKPVKNRDLWQELATEVRKHAVQWRWIKGHSGSELNERADKIAAMAVPLTRRQASLWLDMDREFDRDLPWCQ